jgi:hypothetical protein
MQPSRSERLRHWLMNGSAAPATMTCAHDHQWTGSSRSATLLRPVHRRWFWLPVGLFRMVYGNRSMEPVPITYVMAAVVGGVLGAALDFVLGWPWWLIAVGFVAAVWLFFFASAFWGQDPIRSDNVRDVIDPSGREAREFARLEETISADQLVGMEVVGWTGSRSLGGWGGSSHPDHVTLRHGNPELDEAWVSVTTRSSERDVARLEWRKDDLFRELLHSEEQPPEGLNVDERHRWLWKQERRIEETKPGEWSTTAMTIDGTVTRSDVIQRGDRWVAVAVAEGAVVEVMARGLVVGTMELNRISSLKPYIQGTQQLNAAHRHEHGH